MSPGVGESTNPAVTGSVYTERELDLNLRAELASFTGRPVGLVEVPFADNTKPSFPYAILYPITGGDLIGSWDQPTEDAEVVYQVTSVAQGKTGLETVKSLRWLSDRVRRFFLERDEVGYFAHPISAGAGYVVTHRSLELRGGVDRGDKNLLSVAERYRLSVDRVPS